MKNTLAKFKSKKPESLQSKTYGFTMVEIMVAMVVGLILTAGTIQVFVGNKQTYRTTEASSRLQENARFAISMITKDIRMAGYTGCYSGALSSVENILNDQTNYGWSTGNVLQGYNYSSGTTWSPVLNSALTNVVAGTDVITLRRMDGNGIALVSPFNTGAQLFIDPAANNLVQGEILMVTDCTKGSIFQNTNLQAAGGKINVVHSGSGAYAPGNSTPTLANSYGADAELARLVTTAYYIRNNSYGSPSLYRSSLSTSSGTTTALNANELVENIENIQILYGEDTDADKVANFYGNASEVTMDNVVSVRITLTVRTDNNVSMSDQTHSTTGATDRRLRQAFTTTIGIRNRLN